MFYHEGVEGGDGGGVMEDGGVDLPSGSHLLLLLQLLAASPCCGFPSVSVSQLSTNQERRNMREEGHMY